MSTINQIKQAMESDAYCSFKLRGQNQYVHRFIQILATTEEIGGDTWQKEYIKTTSWN